MAEQGWVKLHRCIINNSLWTASEPFDHRSAWISLILMANHEDREIIVQGSPLMIHRGQKFTSIRKLAEYWHWSKDKVRRFFDTLCAASMILVQTTHNGTLITLENYDFYQGACDTRQDTDKDTDEHTGGSTASTRTRPKQESKNGRMKKNERKEDGRSSLSPEGVPYQ